MEAVIASLVLLAIVGFLFYSDHQTRKHMGQHK
jgi:hypothetical protein